MPLPTGVGNRGPAAAAANHTAILDAARLLFAERGLHVPLSAIAREAGVGQGVLYRHFPNRLDLAFAVFDENLDELETLAAEPSPDALRRVWRRLVEMMVDSNAFVELAIEGSRQTSAWPGAHRLPALFAAALDRAQRSGTADAALTVDDLLLAQRMIYGVVTTEPGERTPTLADVDRAMALVAPTLAAALSDR